MEKKFKFKVVGTSKYKILMTLSRHCGREQAEKNLAWLKKEFAHEIKQGITYIDLRIENI